MGPALALRLQPAGGLGLCQTCDEGQKQPYWPSGVNRVHIKPALTDLKITDPVGWHTLRYSLGTLVKANGEDVKTIQETLRHAKFKVTMDVYTQEVTEGKRSAHSRVVR